MTYLTSTSPAPLRTVVSQWVADFIERRRESVARKQTFHALRSLDNHALKDLAINRSEIFSVAYVDNNERKRRFSK